MGGEGGRGCFQSYSTNLKIVFSIFLIVLSFQSSKVPLFAGKVNLALIVYEFESLNKVTKGHPNSTCKKMWIILWSPTVLPNLSSVLSGHLATVIPKNVIGDLFVLRKAIYTSKGGRKCSTPIDVLTIIEKGFE